jgi:hypothetical protein
MKVAARGCGVEPDFDIPVYSLTFSVNKGPADVADGTFQF